MKARLPHPFIMKISQYYCWDILDYCSEFSKSIFYQDTSKTDINATKLYYVHGKTIRVTGWGLSYLCYFACRHASRHSSSKRIKSDLDFLLIYALFDEYHNHLDGEILRRNRGKTLLYVHCFFGEQQRFQMVKPQYDTLRRTMYMIDTILRKNYPQIPIDAIFQEKFSLSMREVAAILLASWTSSVKSHYLWKQFTNTKGLFVPERTIPVFDYYSTTPEKIKASSIGSQLFYSKPLIKTSDGNYLLSNIYLYIFTFLEFPYWVIKDYYLQLDSREFTSAYGECFEIYFKELLAEYLDSSMYSRIPEERKKKRADWKLEIGGYKILVEQKSSVASILSKQQFPDIDKTEKFISRNWVSAIKQLSNTERDYNDGDYIKMILVADDYFMDEVLDCAFDVDESCPDNDGRYWLVSIDMMEVLLHTFKNSPDKFSQIMDEKNHLELSHSKDGRDLFRIINKYGIDKNYHINQSKYSQFLDDIKEEVIKDIS